jgi:uracil-DNA glycosylase
MPNVFNPWKDYDRLHDMSANAPAIRSDNLERYLAARVGRARFIFTGEAPGHQGAKFSGIAMTSERILLGNKNGITPDCVFVGPKSRSSKEELYPLGATEPTASIAWALLLQLGLAPEEFIFWNSLPTHPHRAGDLLTNRAPKPPELNQAKHLLPLMLSMTPKAQVIAVGRVAQKALGALGVTAACVRHPAMGGATAFRAQVSELLG